MSEQEINNLNVGIDLVEKINKHDFQNEGKIDISLIEKWTNYSNRCKCVEFLVNSQH